MLTHHYRTVVTWTGNRGTGTSGYADYDRTHEVRADGPPPLPGSSDPAFRGDAQRWNPEQLLLAALSQCHLLSYLHVCADNGIVVVEYTDRAEASMRMRGGAGAFVSAVLRPEVTVASADMVSRADALHDDAHRACFIANSVNFPVSHEPVTRAA